MARIKVISAPSAAQRAKVAPAKNSAGKSSIEEYLLRLTSIEIDFDIDDALETLDRLELWKDREEFRVVPVEEATKKLERHSQDGLSRGYHARLLGIAE